MTRTNRYVSKHFALRSALLTFYALLQWRWGFLRALATLFTLTAILDVGLALYFRERFRRAGLGYWDEAAASLLIGLLAGFASV